ncbi:MAG: hypothetical protein PHH83_04090 [Patescibacteria group bacterium]|nr:hypothetical protein [Patescibacteria group bacterium]
MSNNNKEDLGLVIDNYKKKGFDVLIKNDFLIIKKPGYKTKKISIKMAIKLLNAFLVELQ